MLILNQSLRVNVFNDRMKVKYEFYISRKLFQRPFRIWKDLLFYNRFIFLDKQEELWKMLQTWTYSQSIGPRQWFNRPAQSYVSLFILFSFFTYPDNYVKVFCTLKVLFSFNRSIYLDKEANVWKLVWICAHSQWITSSQRFIRPTRS
jgi:hypothetical protein